MVDQGSEGREDRRLPGGMLACGCSTTPRTPPTHRPSDEMPFEAVKIAVADARDSVVLFGGHA